MTPTFQSMKKKWQHLFPSKGNLLYGSLCEKLWMEVTISDNAIERGRNKPLCLNVYSVQPCENK